MGNLLTQMIDRYDEQALGHDIVVAGFLQLQFERHFEASRKPPNFGFGKKGFFTTVGIGVRQGELLSRTAVTALI